MPTSPYRQRWLIHRTHYSDFWVATVGQTLRGRRVRVKRRGRDYVEVSDPLRDPAAVRAMSPRTFVHGGD